MTAVVIGVFACSRRCGPEPSSRPLSRSEVPVERGSSWPGPTPAAASTTAARSNAGPLPSRCAAAPTTAPPARDPHSRRGRRQADPERPVSSAATARPRLTNVPVAYVMATRARPSERYRVFSAPMATASIQNRAGLVGTTAARTALRATADADAATAQARRRPFPPIIAPTATPSTKATTSVKGRSDDANPCSRMSTPAWVELPLMKETKKPPVSMNPIASTYPATPLSTNDKARPRRVTSLMA